MNQVTIFANIRADLANDNCVGFFFESDGNSILVDKDSEKLRATYGSWSGRENVVEDETIDSIEARIDYLLAIDSYYSYIPRFKPVRWSEHAIERFMTRLPIDMCRDSFEGFELKAYGEETFEVQRSHIGFADWLINGKVADFVDVINQTRAKLNEDVFWEYSEL
jgi:hypothetical protein